VGNLSVGGTGKTPMIEYLIRLLETTHNIATLSRGYKRKTEGFILADGHATALTIGDEPFQFYNKFQDVIVSVDTDRQNGISKLMELKNPPQIILLDDAFQHRKVKAKFQILLTAYENLYCNDMVLPTGNLREPKSGAKRADIIVVTKCPESLSEIDKNKIVKSLKPEENQHVFFSWVRYSKIIKSLKEQQELDFLKEKKVSLVTGIANSKPLVDYLNSQHFNFEHLNFDDHHEFTQKDMQELKQKEWILTTEKDFMRLSPHFKNDNRLFYLPIELKIDRDDIFNTLIRNIITTTV
jgi:tetraacyldisaccharide 4'-kinase